MVKLQDECHKSTWQNSVVQDPHAPWGVENTPDFFPVTETKTVFHKSQSLGLVPIELPNNVQQNLVPE